MYQQPYDPYVGYQPYNDPQPEHYATGVPPGMPQPSRPSAFSSTEPPAYPSYYGSNNNSYESQPYGSQSIYGSQYDSKPYGSQPSYYPANPTPAEDQYTPSYGAIPHSSSNQYPPLAVPHETSPSLSHSGSHQYPPPLGHSSSLASSLQYPPSAPSDYFPAVSSGGYPSSHSEPPGENPWGSTYRPRQDGEERLQSHAVSKRDDKKENVSFSVDEAQAIIKQLKETIKSLNLQLTNSRDSTSKVVQEKEATIEQLRREIEAARSLQSQAVNPEEAVATVEREWQQRVASREQEILARTQGDADAMAEKVAKAQQENAALLARISKLQSDSDSGRAFLLETNAAVEAELVKVREEAKQLDAEVLRLKDETEKQETELMKLREETSKLLDETTQIVDEKDSALDSITKLEDEKRALEEGKRALEEEKRELEMRLTQLKEHSDGRMAESAVVAAEKSDLLRRITGLEQELEECRDLCEDRRLRIESFENEELPTLNSQLDLMANLDEEARLQISKLEEKLEDHRHSLEGLEKQLNDAETREMETSLRAAGESRVATEELQRLRFELDSHMLGKSENSKSVSKLESEKTILEQRAAQMEDEKKETLERVSALEKSLKEVTEAKAECEEEIGIIRELLDRETQKNDAQKELRLKIEHLEEQVLTLSSTKSTLETRVSESETKVHETERLLHATEDMLKLLKEDLEQKRELEVQAKGAVGLSEEKAVLEKKLVNLEAENAQRGKQIAKWTERVQVLEEERDGLCYKIDDMEKVITDLEDILAEKDEALTGTEVELLAKKRLEREIKGLKIELGKEKTEMERLKGEVEDLSRLADDSNGKIFLLEDNRSQIEAKLAAILEDKKRAAVKASQLGDENKELKQRFDDTNTKFLEIMAERDELEQINRNLLRQK